MLLLFIRQLINRLIALFSAVVISIVLALPSVASAVTFVDYTDYATEINKRGTPTIQWVLGVLILLAIAGLITGIGLAVNGRKSGRHKSLALVLIIISSIVVALTPFVWALISFNLSTKS